jgi:4-alpha-methyl-delta7-sterol-4alpha-methyl oxidase
MLDAILASYRDPLFRLFFVYTSLVSMGAFLLFAAPLTWVAVREPAWAAKHRIQARRMRPERMIWPSVRLWLLNNLAMSALTFLAWPLLVRVTRVHAGPLPTPWVIAAQVLLFIVVDDFVYYWMHRTLHRGWLYKKIHSVHHRMPTPWAITAHFMHPVEFILTGTLVILWPSLVGAHVVTVYCWVAFRQWEAAEGHSGYSFPWSPSKLFPLYDGVEYHDFHHAKFTGNYAGFLSYLDGVFGAYSKGYKERLAEKRAGVTKSDA